MFIFHPSETTVNSGATVVWTCLIYVLVSICYDML